MAKIIINCREPYFYIRDYKSKDEKFLLHCFCQNNNRIMLLPLYYEDQIEEFIKKNKRRMKILEEVIILNENGILTPFGSPKTVIGIQDLLLYIEWDFSAVFINANLEILYFVRGFEFDDCNGLRIKEVIKGSFLRDIYPEISNKYQIELS
ncbi:hypothetical protein ABH14_07575 [Brevibacillus brevis]|uniref:hypothetical protein n=1 Tax=Brevibacillus brevis TaxID=1393 RepID=UPI0019007730|nr:hypothetical protein [Brevibacillus brevis]MBH0329667.1 hypothetical protein [Brevibacillus brevis]